MDPLMKPVEHLQFLELIQFQKIFKLLLFQVRRDENGRLAINSRPTNVVFFCAFGILVWYFSLNAYAIMRSLHLENQNPAVIGTSAFFGMRGLIIFIKRRDIMDFLRTMDHEFPKDLATQRKMGVPKIYEAYLKRHHLVNIYVNVALIGFCCLPVIVYIFTYVDRNTPINLNQQLLGGFLPFNARQSHQAYPFVWIHDVVSIVVCTSFFASFDTLFYAFQAQIIMHLDHLSRQLESINVEDSVLSNDDTMFYGELYQLIRRQQHLNLICDKFNDIYKNGLMVMDFVSSGSICFHLYLISESEDLLTIFRFILPSVALVVFTFEICYRGTLLEEASSRLNTALYKQNWYVGSKKYRKLILIWLKYAQCTKQIKALGMIEVNVMHFADIMKLAYRLFTFLKSRQ